MSRGPTQFGTLGQFIESASEMDPDLRLFVLGEWRPEARAVVTHDTTLSLHRSDAHAFYAEVFGDGPAAPDSAAGARFFLYVGQIQLEKKRLRKARVTGTDEVTRQMIEHARRLNPGL
jgi:hypothetical protein